MRKVVSGLILIAAVLFVFQGDICIAGEYKNHAYRKVYGDMNDDSVFNRTANWFANMGKPNDERIKQQKLEKEVKKEKKREERRARIREREEKLLAKDKD